MNMIVDDKPENVYKWAAKHVRGVGVIWHQSYTPEEDLTRHFNVVRFKAWEQVYQMAKKIGANR